MDRAKADIERITSDQNGFGVEMTLQAPAPGEEMAIVTGLHTKIHMALNTEGALVNSKKGHISISEKFLVDAGYPVRNSNDEVDLKGHKVSVKDSTGVIKHYLIQQWFPNESVGLITCILDDLDDSTD